MNLHGRELRSSIDGSGRLLLSLEEVEVGDPGDDEVIVRVEATPVNPSDLGLLLGPADLSTIEGVPGGRSAVSLSVPKDRLAGVEGRLGRALLVGNEGAGTVIAAGRNVSALKGRIVGMAGGGMYVTHRRIRGDDVIPLPAGATAADGAAMFVNPLTALGFVHTARSQGHGAIVHTVAASSLGRMLQRVCLADGIPLVSIVRSPEQVELLRGDGATHVLNSRDDDFDGRLADAIEETGATVAFDATGGGTLGSVILQAMERAYGRRMTEYSRYGSDTFKQLYIYGGLDGSPMTLNRQAFGFAWGVSGWLLFSFLRTAEADVVRTMRQRVVDELSTTFASQYSRVVGLDEMLQPDVLRACARRATGGKFLINPSKG